VEIVWFGLLALVVLIVARTVARRGSGRSAAGGSDGSYPSHDTTDCGGHGHSPGHSGGHSDGGSSGYDGGAGGGGGGGGGDSGGGGD
jgi:hypothetical protein